MSTMNEAEANELHELVGAAFETGDTTDLRRARELAALVVSDQARIRALAVAAQNAVNQGTVYDGLSSALLDFQR